ncbi:MAG TPA: hypothetical protein VJ689_00710 [Gaiellaceae bacterium]|nr:hypothetical protein [Gaiellaceae bacterium]
MGVRVLAVIAAVLLLLGAACGGDGDGATDSSAIVIRTKMIIAAQENTEPIATGDILQGSTLEGAPFCAGGTILDSHADRDPAMEPYLIDRTISCPDGTVRVGVTPDVGAETEGRTQKGSWTIVDGTGAFDGLRGSGTMEVVYGSDEDAPVRETLTGTVTR